jgi:hypothetical protein
LIFYIIILGYWVVGMGFRKKKRRGREEEKKMGSCEME